MHVILTIFPKVQVDWTNRTLGVFASQNGDTLKQITPEVLPNLSSTAGPNGQGDFHFGMVKVGDLRREDP